MNEEQILEFYNKLVEHYGDDLANFEHEPRRFAYQVKLYQYYERKQSQNRSSQ